MLKCCTAGAMQPPQSTLSVALDRPLVPAAMQIRRAADASRLPPPVVASSRDLECVSVSAGNGRAINPAFALSHHHHHLLAVYPFMTTSSEAAQSS